MKIRRTANAGVLLELDGVSILMDGVCQEVKPYLATPPEEREKLSACWPDVLVFTHAHKDHYDPDFAAEFQRQTGGVILGPVDLPGCNAISHAVKAGSVEILPIGSRHVGAAGKTTSHVSFVVKGTACVWFLGDASPLQWKNLQGLPQPDVLIAPYAYATSPSSWQTTKALSPQKVVLLHLPQRENDPAELWSAVESVAGRGDGEFLYIPTMGETITLHPAK